MLFRIWLSRGLYVIFATGNARMQMFSGFENFGRFLNGCFFLDGYFATVVAANWAYTVVNMPRTAVRAYCQCGLDGFVVSTALGCAGFGLFSFGMCHCFLYL